MISGDGWGLSFPDICLIVKEESRTLQIIFIKLGPLLENYIIQITFYLN